MEAHGCDLCRLSRVTLSRAVMYDTRLFTSGFSPFSFAGPSSPHLATPLFSFHT